jgi:integrase
LAIEAGKCTVNPVEKVERYRVENERTRELLHEEEERLRKVIREKYVWHEPELDFALHTGVRHGNMYGVKRRNANTPPLDWQNINLPFKEMTFKGTSMKAGRPLRVPLNDVALAALAIWKERSGGAGTVIENEDGSVAHGSKHWFEDAISEAKIEDFTWHDLRHTFATRLRRLGVPLEDIGALLGHSIRSSGFGITARYAHVHMPNLHAAVAKLCPGTNATDTLTDTKPVVEIRKKAANAD